MLQHRVGDLNRRTTERVLDRTFWTVLGGDWRIDTMRDGGVLRGTPGAVARMNIPAGAGKLAEADGGMLRLQGDRVDIVAGDGPIDNVRIRKMIEPAPEAKVGAPEWRVPGRGWFIVGEAANSGATPQTALNSPFWLLGALAVGGGGFCVALAADRAQRSRKKLP